MNFAYLSSTVNIKTTSEEPKKGVFEIEGLFAGYGLTIGNVLRTNTQFASTTLAFGGGNGVIGIANATTFSVTSFN